MKKRVIMGLAILTLLAGCANSNSLEKQQIDKLSADISTLKLRAERLRQDLRVLQPEVQKAKADANRANYRLDVNEYLDCWCSL